jgi:aryl-alcohol dehydrogenase-like predicted oxidoreductase
VTTSDQAVTATRLDDLKLSPLMLGAAQFGMPYGIANRHGQPTYEEVRDIIAAAFEGGVNCLDTAASYGDSEEVIGRALRELRPAGSMVVVTKVRHLPAAVLAGRAAEMVVQRSVEDSLRRLRLEEVPLCLFHREEDFRCVEALLKLKQKGLVRHIGCSVSDPEPTSAIISSGAVDAVQIPANLLDQRFAREGICQLARGAGAAVFARSVYLQGLLLMPESVVPPELAEAVPVLRSLQKIAAEAGMTIAELALRFVMGLDGVTCALVGVDTIGQLRQNLSYAGRGPLDSGLMKTISESVSDLPDSVLKPGLWPRPENQPMQQKEPK